MAAGGLMTKVRRARPRKSPEPELDIRGKPLVDLAFEAAHPGSEILFKNLDPAAQAVWGKIVAVIAAAVREKDAAPAVRKAA